MCTIRERIVPNDFCSISDNYVIFIPPEIFIKLIQSFAIFTIYRAKFIFYGLGYILFCYLR